MNPSHQATFETEADKDEDQGCEELWLVIENSDGLRSRSYGFEKVEFAHSVVVAGLFCTHCGRLWFKLME